MNLLLLEPGELGDGVAGDDGDGVTVRLAGRRAEHLRRVLGVAVGDAVRLGVVGGRRGEGRVTALGPGDAVELAVTVGEVTDGEAPAPRLDLIVGLPRPQALHRLLQSAAAFGVERLELVNAWRVEKSYFSSPSLAADKVRHHLLLGAEQGVTTRLPEVGVHRRLVPFVEELGRHTDPPCRLLAHPEAETPLEDAFPAGEPAAAVALAIGPEGGWIDREVETFGNAGFRPVRLGPWILRVETAVAAALGQLELLRRQAAAVR